MTRKEFGHIVCGRIMESFYDYAHVSNLAYEAIDLEMESIQVFPNTLAYLNSMLTGKTNRPQLCAVIAYPHGTFTAEQKVFEIEDAAVEGADQFEFVINVVNARSCDWDEVRREFMLCRRAAGSKVLKAIVEAEYLRDQELEMVCRIAAEEDIDRLCTSIGVYTGKRGGKDIVAGATPEDVEKMKKICGDSVKIVAMGDIHTVEKCKELIAAGADYICTEDAARLIRNWS